MSTKRHCLPAPDFPSAAAAPALWWPAKGQNVQLERRHTSEAQAVAAAVAAAGRHNIAAALWDRQVARVV